MGISTIACIIVLCLGLTHAVALNSAISGLCVYKYIHNSIHRSVQMQLVCGLLIYSEAALALFCMDRVLRGDPGVIRRSQKTCFPLPEAVKERLAAKKDLTGLNNISELERGVSQPACVCYI